MAAIFCIICHLSQELNTFQVKFAFSFISLVYFAIFFLGG